MEREFTMEEGKAGDEVILDSPDMKFGDKAIRRGFIRKVYMILSVQVRNKGVQNPKKVAELTKFSLSSRSQWLPSSSSRSTSQISTALKKRRTRL